VRARTPSDAAAPQQRDRVFIVNEGKAMDAEQLPTEAREERYAEVFRYYELAKRAEWQVRDLPWNELPPIPELKGSPGRQARRRDVWRSVITQQLQADEFAVEMVAQLFSLAPHNEAKLYYTTMVQDEARHTEAWLKLVAQVGGTAERDPYLDQLAKMTLEADTLEEKVFQMQVFFERLIIPKFRMIARASRGTVLEDLCNRLAVDDGIHHGSGMAYERILLQNASKKTKDNLVKAGNRLLPVFVNHEFWRPRERAWMGSAMRAADVARLRNELEDGIRMAQSLGLDVSGIELPRLSA
jgi:hypothetical protein